MPRRDPRIDAHIEWISFVRPTGLVVSVPALVRAGAVLPRDPEGQRRLRAFVSRGLQLGRDRAVVGLRVALGREAPAEHRRPERPEVGQPRLGPAVGVEPALVHEGGDVLRPDFAVRERDPRDDGSRWQLLIEVIELGDDFDRVAGGAGCIEVSAHGRMERLLRLTGAPAGLLSNRRTLRLVSAPRGESSGWLDLHVADTVTTAGRPIVAAGWLLLGETRLLDLPRDKRFATFVADSRRFQNEVSERPAEPVSHALYELLRPGRRPTTRQDRELLREALAERPVLREPPGPPRDGRTRRRASSPPPVQKHLRQGAARSWRAGLIRPARRSSGRSPRGHRAVGRSDESAGPSRGLRAENDSRTATLSNTV